MKVLFVSKADLPDFQNDMIFHGGRSLLGADFVDSNPMWYMYKEEVALHWKTRVPRQGKSYGGGFTLYGKLDSIEVDRTNISEKIQDHFYDKVIYGSITRCSDYSDLVLKHYSKEDVIFLDGEDNQNILESLLPFGQYYKRELSDNAPLEVKPLNFCIPRELIIPEVPVKEKEYATIIPGDLSTYIYDNEVDYYADYQNSIFGVTFKKGGWDCLRHYEILMNGCIPYFPGLEQCPQRTMTLFPKALVLECNAKLTSSEITLEECLEYTNKLLSYTKEYLTTEYVFRKLVNLP